MSLRRLTIALHCWPTRRPPRRGPGVAPSSDDAAPRRFALADVELDGDDVRDIERFDSMAADAIADVADRLRRVASDRLAALRELGYATRVEVHATADGGPYELALPPAFLDACHRLGVALLVASDGVESAEPIDAYATREA